MAPKKLQIGGNANAEGCFAFSQSSSASIHCYEDCRVVKAAITKGSVPTPTPTGSEVTCKVCLAKR